MGSSGYLAAKSEREVYDYEIAMERDEIALMPEIERDELALIYEAKGMDASAAHALATQVMADPGAHARGAGAGGARRSASRPSRRCAKDGSPVWRPRSARSSRCFRSSSSRDRARSSLRSCSRCCRTSWSVLRARSSPAEASSVQASICSSSDLELLSSATMSAAGSVISSSLFLLVCSLKSIQHGARSHGVSTETAETN